jgi:precorrin-2/cobalt-factor-2 C20-methyltransferase
VTVKGKFYGIGVGPGSPDLLTLKAADLLRRVPVIFVPVKASGESSSAMKIIAPFLDLLDGQEIQELVFPMTRSFLDLKEGWKLAAEDVLTVLDEGKDAAFITLGDSVLYSTYAYLLDALLELEPDLAVETIPGITSFSAAAALFNRALACGKESLAVVPATRGVEFLKNVLGSFENVVLLKVASVLDDVLDILKELDRLDEAVFISRCGMPGQVMLDNLALPGEIPRDYFSLILVGKVER